MQTSRAERRTPGEVTGPTEERFFLEVPQKRDGLHAREIDGETLILDAHGERMHSLNPTASFIFEMIDGRRTVASISEALAEAFDVPVETAEKDTRSLLLELKSLGVLA
jgi:hypothetical protein